MSTELATTPTEQLVMSGWSAAGIIVGLLVGLKYKHPVIGFFIGSAVGGVTGIGYVIMARQGANPTAGARAAGPMVAQNSPSNTAPSTTT